MTSDPIDLKPNQLLEVVPNDLFQGRCKPGDRCRYAPHLFRAIHVHDAHKYIPVKWIDIPQNDGMYHRDMFKVIYEGICGECEAGIDDSGDYLCPECRESSGFAALS